MENLRWILIFAGVAILLLLYLSGRSSSTRAAKPRQTRTRASKNLDIGAGQSSDDPLMGELDSHGFSPPDRSEPGERRADRPAGFDGFDVDPADLERPAGARARAAHDFEAPEPDHQAERMFDAGTAAATSRADDESLPPELRADTRSSGLAETAAGAFGGLSQKIEAIGAKLSARRHERVAENPPADDDEDAPQFASKIITLHVVAPEGQRLDGQALLACFEERGLDFGEMNIFHSMHNAKTVFSVAKMVEPGWFDPHDLTSFETPGITLILQLPGPVAADTAFEVLLSEAFEIAQELGGTVLDGDRSTLSKQTAQHMREGIYEYMHRQKYFGSVTS